MRVIDTEHIEEFEERGQVGNVLVKLVLENISDDINWLSSENIYFKIDLKNIQEGSSQIKNDFG